MSTPVWGAEAIAEVIGCKPKAVYHIAAKGYLKSIRRVGRILIADPEELLREVTGKEDGGAA
jgi:hypothetical protein